MTSRFLLRQLRQRALESAFDLLYGPFVLLHEVVGKAAFGPSWAGRRLELLEHLGPGERVVDVGAGAGHLARAAARLGMPVVGVDPSRSMRAVAAGSGVTVLSGLSWDLPLPDRSCDVIIATYPGPWIFEQATAEEFRRVLAADGRIIVLLGGSVTKGARSGARRRMLAAIYGARAGAPLSQPDVPAVISGRLVAIEDRWGTAYLWIGRPRYEPGDPC